MHPLITSITDTHYPLRTVRALREAPLWIVPIFLILAGCGGSRDAATGDVAQADASGGAARNATVLNSAADEFAPVLLAGGGTCLVTSNRDREDSRRVLSPEFLYGEAIYGVMRSGDAPLLDLDRQEQWTSATVYAPGRFDRVNTGAPAIDAVGGRVYFSATYVNVGDGGGDIHSLPWPIPAVSDPAAFPEAQSRNEVALNSPWWDAHPAISADGRTIVFASDRVAVSPSVKDTGRRAPQLWIATRSGDGWGAPAPLPAPVNSGTAEMSPHYGVDGWLYFATKRWPEAGWEIARTRPEEGGGWSVPERLRAPFNSAYDDVFPFLGDDRMQMLFASNRPGGKGGYDIWFAEMKYCVPLDVHVRLADAQGAAFVSGEGIMLEVVETATGRVVAEESTGSDGHMRAQCLRVDTEYSVLPSSRSCYDDPAPVTFRTPMPADIGDGVQLTVDLHRKALPEFYVVEDSIPFFVTGYWYPNTTAELARLRSRLEGGRELPTANFIDTSDYDYDAAAKRVDLWFEDLYAAIDRMLVPMLDSCYGAADTLIIQVQGHVDPRGLAWGKFDEKDEIRTLGAVIRPGEVMQRQEGNVKLSHLRAWYARRMIDRAMEAHSDRYRSLRDQRRIRYEANGGYIGFGDSGSTAGPVNDPLKRKFTVTVEVRKRVGG